MKGVIYQVEQSANNMDVGRCKNLQCEKHISYRCYRIISQASEYDFARICDSSNEFKWYIKDKTEIMNTEDNTNKESENINGQE